MPLVADIQARQVQLRANTADDQARTIEAVVATENVVTVLDTETWRAIDEVLLVRGAVLPKQVPMLSDHIRLIDNVAGSARDLRVDASRITARLHFAGDAESRRVWELVRDDHVGGVSIGYRVEEAVEIRPGESATVAGRTYTAGERPLRIVSRWSLKEVSLVVVPADADAHTRSIHFQHEESQRMPHRILADALAPMFRQGNGQARWPDVARAALSILGEPAPCNDYEATRALTANATIGEAVDALFNSIFLAAWEAEVDTTLGWTREMPAANFLQSELYVMATGGRLEKLPRGDTAEESGLGGLAKTSYRLARYARQIVVDEQEMIDGGPLGAILLAVAQMGGEARRLRPDLVYSLILSNGAMAYDSVDLFHATHANLGTAALGSASLKTGMGAIGNQVLTDAEGDPIHLNNRGKLLIVPPDLVITGREAAHASILGDGDDLWVRQESRLGAAGVVDPDTDQVVTGTATNWLLAARSAALPGVVVLGLDGRLTPEVRRFNLKGGRFGLAWDIKLDIAVVAVDHRAVYWSTGAGE